MRRRGKILVGVLSVAAALAVGCTERGTPTQPLASSDPAFARPVPAHPVARTVSVLQRQVPLGTGISATVRVGPEGGVLDLPAAGLRVRIPPNAIAHNGAASVEITVTAVPGSGVAYTFQPHGLVFHVPLQVEQSFAGTAAALDPISVLGAAGGYFDTAPSGPTATTLETRPTLVDFINGKLYFSVEHFSGYLVAVG